MRERWRGDIKCILNWQKYEVFKVLFRNMWYKKIYPYPDNFLDGNQFDYDRLSKKELVVMRSKEETVRTPGYPCQARKNLSKH